MLNKSPLVIQVICVHVICDYKYFNIWVIVVLNLLNVCFSSISHCILSSVPENLIELLFLYSIWEDWGTKYKCIICGIDTKLEIIPFFCIINCFEMLWRLWMLSLAFVHHIFAYNSGSFTDALYPNHWPFFASPSQTAYSSVTFTFIH